MLKSVFVCVIFISVSLLAGCNMPVSYAWFCDPAYLAKKQQALSDKSKPDNANWQLADHSRQHQRQDDLRKKREHPLHVKAVDDGAARHADSRATKKTASQLKIAYLPEAGRKIVRKPDAIKKKKLAALDGALVSKDTEKRPDGKDLNRQNNRADKLTLLRKVEGIQHPQSVAFDKKRLRFYVSRHGVKAANKMGAIALLARDGSLTDANWITGLDQPRGMAVVGNYLYVADGSSVIKIDIDQSVVVGTYQNKGTFFFHDVAASPKGEVFVTDPLMNSIYKLVKSENASDEHDYQLQVWLQSQRLSGPNSLFVDGDQMFVGSIGLNKLAGDAASQKLRVINGKQKSDSQMLGGLFKVDIASKNIRRLSKISLPQLSSVVPDGEGSIYATISGRADLLRFSAKTGELLERINVGRQFELKSARALGDIQYFSQSKEFWVPVKDNGHLLVFVRSDAVLVSEEQK